MKKAYRVTVFVPPAQLELLLTSITKVLSANNNQYSEVFWWSAPGVEQFRPLAGSHPTSGIIGELSRVKSIALKFLIPRDAKLLRQIIETGVRQVHPWESPVITIDECHLA